MPGERLGDGYNIRAPYPGMQEVIVNLKRGTHLLSVPPESVDFFFAQPYEKDLRQAAPFCTGWEVMPSERERPWLYRCQLHAPHQTPISVYASLTGDLHDAHSRVRQLSLQVDL